MATVHLVPHPDGWVRHADQHQDGRAAFGMWLRRAREARGLTLDDVIRETKISLRNLEALEHGQLGALPEFYQRAEVRAVARALGVDERIAIGRLDSAITPVVASAEAGVPRRPQKLGLSVGLVAVAVGALVLTAAGMGRTVFDRMATPQPAPTLAAPVESGPTEVTRTRVDLPAAATTSQAPVTVAFRPSAIEVSPAIAVGDAATTAVDEAATTSETPAMGAVTELVVRTEPSGAHVTVNGIGWGASPVTIRHLPPGDKHIRATKEGFAATERRLTLDNGQQQALDLRLATAP